MKNLHIIAASMVFCVVVSLIWSKSGATNISSNAAAGSDRNVYEKPTSRPNHISPNRLESKPFVAQKAVQPLDLPSTNAKLEIEKDEAAPARVPSGDDAILAKGGLLETAVKKEVVAEDLRVKRLKSIVAADWDGKGNLLVNELRAGKGFEITLDKIKQFLGGEDLFGWPVGQRNWIGDEMMTMLRQEMPDEGYKIFSELQANPDAPAAMRDYSIQHISHLIADGKVGSEGVEVITQAFQSGDPVLISTALISLHRLSEKTPHLVKRSDVQDYAKQSLTSTDERLTATAKAISREE